MWYKRSIENYFPNEAYISAGMDPSLITESGIQRDYVKITSSNISGYDKDKLQLLTCAMSRQQFEDNLKQFNINGENLSEFQLFLLKLVRII